MADDKKAANEQYIDAISDTSSNMETLYTALAALGRNASDLNAAVSQIGGDFNVIAKQMERTRTGLNKYINQKGQLADPVANQKAGFNALNQMNAADIKGIQKSFQAMIKSGFEDPKQAKAMVNSFNEEWGGLLSDVTNMVKTLRTNVKASAKKQVEEIFSAGTGAASYKAQAAEMAKSQLRRSSSKEAIGAVYNQGRAKDLYYPASSGGATHQRNADVFTHSMDTAAAIKEIMASKDRAEQIRAQLLKEGYKSNDPRISLESITKAISDASVKENAIGAALIHDLAKSGGDSKISGRGYNAEHADQLSSKIKVEGLSSEAAASLDKFTSIAETHHTQLSLTELATTADIVSGALVKMGDAVSANNANPIGERGVKEGVADGYTQHSISNRATIADSPNYQSVRGSAWLEDDPREYVLKQMIDVMSGSEGHKIAGLAELQRLGLGELGEIALKADPATAQYLNYAMSAEGKSVLGKKAITGAASALAGVGPGYFDEFGKPLDPKVLGQSLKLTDPALIWAQALRPGIHKGLEQVLRTSSAEGVEVDTRLLDKAQAAGATKPATELADRIADLGKAINTVLEPHMSFSKMDRDPRFGEVKYLDHNMDTLSDIRDLSARLFAEPKRVEPKGKSYEEQREDLQRTTYSNPRYNDLVEGPVVSDYMKNLQKGVNESLAKTELDPNDLKISDLLNRAIERALSTNARMEPGDLEKISSAQKSNMSQLYLAEQMRAGKPQLEAGQIAANIEKTMQSIQESIAKSAIMSARAARTRLDTEILGETKDAVVGEKVASAQKANIEVLQTQLKLQREQITQEDQIAQAKAKTQKMMSELTEEQRAQIKEATKAGLEENKLTELPTYEAATAEIEEYKQRAIETQTAIQELKEAEIAAAEAAVKRSEAYKDQSKQILTRVKAGGSEDQAKLELDALKQAIATEGQVEKTKVDAAKRAVSAGNEELELVRDRMLLESNIISEKAKAAQTQAAAQVKEIQVEQEQLSLQLSQATQEDLIAQAHLKTLQMQEDLKAKILSSQRSYVGSSKESLELEKEALNIARARANEGLLKNLYRSSGVNAESRDAGWNPSNMSILGKDGGLGNMNTGQLKYSARNFTWGVIGGLAGVASATQLLRESVSNMKDYETAVVNLKRVWQDVPKNQVLTALTDMNDMALRYGQTIQDVAKIQEEWAKVGIENAPDLAELSKTAILALNTSDMTDPGQVVAYMNSARIQMGLAMEDTSDLLDSWNKLADVTTADTSDYAEAYQRAAGYAHQLGVSSRELDVIISTMIENTGRSGEEIGTALRQMFANVYTNLNIKKLRGLGVDVYADELTGTYLQFDEILANIVKRYNELKALSGGAMSGDLVSLLNVLGNTRQRNFAISLLEGYDKTGLGANASADNYMDISKSSSGYSMQKFEMTMDTLTYKSTLLQAAFTQAANAFGETGVLDIMKGMIDCLSNILTGYAELDPVTRNWITSLGIVAIAMKGLGTLTKATLGENLSKALIQNILNTKKFNASLVETTKNFINLDKKQMKAQYAKTNIDIGMGTGTLTTGDLAKKLAANKALQKSLEELAAKSGKPLKELQEAAELAMKAVFGDKEAGTELNARLNADVAAQVQQTTDAHKAAGDAAQTASVKVKAATDSQIAGQTELAEVTQGATAAVEGKTAADTANTDASILNAAADKLQTGSKEGVEGAALGAAGAEQIETAADVEQAGASVITAAAEMGQAAAQDAVGRSAAAAAVKVSLLTMGLNLLIGAAIAGAMSLITHKKAQDQLLDRQIVLVQKEYAEIAALTKLGKKYDEAEARTKDATLSTEERAEALDNLKKVQAELADAAPALATYYDTEMQKLIANNKLLADYLKYKKLIADTDTAVVIGSYDKVSKNLDNKIDDSQKKLELYSRLSDLAYDSKGYTSEVAIGGKSYNYISPEGDIMGAGSFLEQFGMTEQDFKDAGLIKWYQAFLGERDLIGALDTYLLEIGDDVENTRKDLENYLKQRNDLEESYQSSMNEKAMSTYREYDTGLDYSNYQPDVQGATERVNQTVAELESYSSGQDELQNALDNIMKQKVGSSKYNAALGFLESEGYMALEVLINGEYKQLGELSPDQLKSNMPQISQVVEAALKERISDQINLINTTIEASKAGIAEIDAKVAEIEANQIPDIQEVINSAFTGRSPKARSEYRADPVAWLTENGADEDTIERVRAAVAYMNEYKAQLEQLDGDKTAAMIAMSDAWNQLMNLSPEDIVIETINYSSLAQDYADKLSKIKNSADLKAVLDEIILYFGDIPIMIDGVAISLSELGAKEAMDHLGQVILAMNLKGVRGYQEEYGGMTGITQTTQGILDQVKAVAADLKEQGTDVDYAVDGANDALNQIGSLMSNLGLDLDKVELDPDLETWLAQYEEGAIEAESFAARSAKALDTLADALRDGWDATNPDIKSAGNMLRGLFGDLTVMGELLGEQSDVWLAENANAIADALDAEISQRDQVAQEFALGQVAIIEQGITDLANILANTDGVLDAMINALVPILGDQASSFVKGYIADLQGQLETLKGLWNNIASGIKANGTKPVSGGRSGGGGGGGGNKWDALDKQLKKVARTISDLTGSMDMLQTIWANDLTNLKYLEQAYVKQTDVIQAYIEAIDEVNKLREQTKGDVDKYNEMTDLLDDYTKSLISAYQQQSELFSTEYQDRIEESTRKLGYANNALELYLTSLRPYNKTLKDFNANQEYWAQNIDSIAVRYRATTSEIARVKDEIKDLERVMAEAPNSFKATYAAGQIDYLKDKVEELQNTLVDLGNEAEAVRARMIGAFTTLLTDEYNDRLDEQLKRIKAIRKEEEKRHKERLDYLNALLKDLDKERKADEDQRQLQDLEAEMEIVRIRIRRLSADTSQYGQKLLKDAYKQLGELEKQYNKKVQDMSDEAYKEAINDQIKAEDDSYKELTDALDDEEEAYKAHYQTLIDNAESFAQGLYDRYVANQQDVVNYLKSQGLLDSYTEAAKMAAAAYNAGISLGMADSGMTFNKTTGVWEPSLKWYEDYEATPDNSYNNTGTSQNKPYDTGIDYQAKINETKALLSQATSKSQAAALYAMLKEYEHKRNLKLTEEEFKQYGTETHAYQGDFETWWNENSASLPIAHTGGQIGAISPALSSLFGLDSNETLVKALKGEYLIPEDLMDNVLPNLRDTVVKLLSEMKLNPEDFSNLNMSTMRLPSNIGSTSTDNSVDIDKVLNIEHATFENPLDVETLEDVAGRYIRDLLARKGSPKL